MLIDEPEISLHVDWQRIIIAEITRQANGRQVIVCTHAPEIAADHRDVLAELKLKPWTEAALFPSQSSLSDAQSED